MTKKHLRFQAFALVCCLAGAIAAPAQDTISPQKRALIDELLVVNQAAHNMEEAMTMMFGALSKTMPGMVSKSLPDQVDDKGALSQEAREAAAELAAARMDRLKEMLLKQINVPDMIERVIVPLYDKYYTESELRDLIAFYKTPTGQKSVAVQPQLTSEAMSKTMEYLMPKMDAMIKQISDEMLNDVKKTQDGRKSKN